MLIDTIHNELFKKHTELVEINSENAKFAGKEHYNVVFYSRDEFGFYIWISNSKNSQNQLFEPINPTSFRYSSFFQRGFSSNRPALIFIPTKIDLDFDYLHPIPFLNNKGYYLLRSNISIANRYSSNPVWTETNNIKEDYYFLLFSTGFDKLHYSRLEYETDNMSEYKSYAVLPEFFNRSLTINIKNLKEVWMHYLCASDYDYYSYFKKQDWILTKVSELTLKSFSEFKEPELDDDLKRLLGL